MILVRPISFGDRWFVFILFNTNSKSYVCICVIVESWMVVKICKLVFKVVVLSNFEKNEYKISHADSCLACKNTDVFFVRVRVCVFVCVHTFDFESWKQSQEFARINRGKH